MVCTLREGGDDGDGGDGDVDVADDFGDGDVGVDVDGDDGGVDGGDCSDPESSYMVSSGVYVCECRELFVLVIE